jgi:hypothetical protein
VIFSAPLVDAPEVSRWTLAAKLWIPTRSIDIGDGG